MTQTRFTKGPWTWLNDNFLESATDEVLGLDETEGGKWSSGDPMISHAADPEVKEANKALIAAAPLMYEALERLVENYLSIVPDDLEAAEAALRTARGETQDQQS